jgi:hypothetical protein
VKNVKRSICRRPPVSRPVVRKPKEHGIADLSEATAEATEMRSREKLINIAGQSEDDLKRCCARKFPARSSYDFRNSSSGVSFSILDMTHPKNCFAPKEEPA